MKLPSVPMLSRLGRNGWSTYHIANAVGLTLLAVVVTSGGWYQILWEAFHLPWAAHIALVPGVVVLLAIRRRSRWVACRRVDARPGLAILGGGLMCWALAWLTDLQTPFHLGTVLITAGTAAAVLGRDVLVHFFPCFLVLLLMVPLPETAVVRWIDPAAERFLAHFADAFYYFTGLLDTRVIASHVALIEIRDNVRRIRDWQFVGYAVVVEGRRLELNGFYIGLPLVMDLVLATYAMVFLLSMRTWARLATLAVAPGLGLIVGAAGLTATLGLWVRPGVDPSFATQRLMGWTLLVASLLLLLGLVRWLAWARVPVRRFTLATEA